MQKFSSDRRLYCLLFLFALLYSIAAMIISRELVIPAMLPHTNGNISGDPNYYNSLAVKKLVELKSQGLKAFELHLSGQGPAGIASLAYLVWENPYIIVTFNALMHSFSVVLMAAIISRWFPLNISIAASIPLLISPYMMFWYSQINKGSYSMLGAMLFTLGSVLILTSYKKWRYRTLTLSVSFMCLAAIFNWIARPYLNQILTPLVIATMFCGTLFLYKKVSGTRLLSFIVGMILVTVCTASLTGGAASDQTLDSFSNYTFHRNGNPKIDIPNEKSIAASCLENISTDNWRTEKIIPDFIENNLLKMMGQRCLVFSILNTDFNETTQAAVVDISILPSSSIDAVKYLPRAVYLGVLSPGPDRWGFIFTEHFSWFFLVSSIETIFLYFGVIVLIFWVFKNLQWSIFLPIGSAIFVMTIYGMSIPYLGAIYRYRYPWWMLLICFSAAAILSLFCKKNATTEI